MCEYVIGTSASLDVRETRKQLAYLIDRVTAFTFDFLIDDKPCGDLLQNRQLFFFSNINAFRWFHSALLIPTHQEHAQSRTVDIHTPLREGSVPLPVQCTDHCAQ
ncbi:hypothetical protein AQI84_18610 [Streptomyces griseorubiginosus]|nr:hypothetical protein AQI84_18610 [Streptomyces griseorubiginosus]